MLQSVVQHHLGNVPHVYDLASNVSFILQNGHASVSYARPLLPNVAEVACIHCRAAKPLPKVRVFVSWWSWFHLNRTRLRNAVNWIHFVLLHIGTGRFCCRFRWIRFHLCVNGLVGQSDQNARTFATPANRSVRATTISRAVEVGKWTDWDARATIECQDEPMVATTGYSGYAIIFPGDFIPPSTFTLFSLRSSEAQSFCDARRIVEHVRECLPWCAASHDAGFLRSRC